MTAIGRCACFSLMHPVLLVSAQWWQHACAQYYSDYSMQHMAGCVTLSHHGCVLQAMKERAWSKTEMKIPRVCLLSGMTGEEQVGIAEYWKDFAGCKPPIFAAVVPETVEKPTLAVIKVHRDI
jgi:hypothetical protein